MKKLNLKDTSAALLAAAALAGLLGAPVCAQDDTSSSGTAEKKPAKAGKASKKKASGKSSCSSKSNCAGKSGCHAK